MHRPTSFLHRPKEVRIMQNYIYIGLLMYSKKLRLEYSKGNLFVFILYKKPTVQSIKWLYHIYRSLYAVKVLIILTSE